MGQNPALLTLRDGYVLEKVLYQPASAQPAPEERPRIRLVAGGRFGQAFVAANENGGEGPGPSAA